MRAERAASFARVADAYERARPEYPADAVLWLAGETPCDVVDLGAGTGKLTRSLDALGHHVVAVEPLAEMLDQLRTAVPGVTAVVGSAGRCRCPMRPPTSSCARRRSTGSTRSPPSRRSRAPPARRAHRARLERE